MIKKIFSHSLIYGVAPQIPRLAFFLILPFIMPFLTKNDFGVFGIVTAYTLALNSIKELGLRVVFSNTLIKHPNHIKKLWGHLYGFLYLWNFVFALIIILILYFIIPVEASEKRWLIILLNVLPIVFFGVTMTIGQIYYQFTKRPMQIAARALIIGSIAVWLNYYTMAILKIGYMGFFWSAFVSAILYNISYWYPLNFIENIKPKFCFKWKFIKSSLKIGLPLVPHSFAAYLINTSDRIIMQNLNVSTANIGSYNFVSNFGTLAATITQATTQAMSPFLMENYKNKKDYEARNLIFIWQAGISILFFIGSLWLKEIFILMVTNNEFVDLYPLAIILVMAQLYRPMYAGGIAKLFYLNKTSFLYKVTLTAGVINILLNLFFIPIYGFEFVVYSTYITFLLQGYLFFIYPVFKEVNPIKFYPLFWLTLQLILSATVYLIRDINIPYKIIITGGTILIVSILFFKYKKKII